MAAVAATVGGVSLAYGLKAEATGWTCFGASFLVGGGVFVRLCPVIRYRDLRSKKRTHRAPKKISLILRTCITNRKQAYIMWLGIICVLVAGLLGNEFSRNLLEYRWMNSVLKVRCIYGIWTVILMLLTGALIYVFRDKIRKDG